MIWVRLGYRTLDILWLKLDYVDVIEFSLAFDRRLYDLRAEARNVIFRLSGGFLPLSDWREQHTVVALGRRTD